MFLKETLSLDVCCCSSFAFLPCLKKEDGFQRRNWGAQIELRAAKGPYAKLFLKEYNLDSENAVYLYTDVWKVFKQSQNNCLKYRNSIKICAIFFTGCCKGKQCAAVKFQCMVKAFLPFPRWVICKQKQMEKHWSTFGWKSTLLSFRLSVWLVVWGNFVVPHALGVVERGRRCFRAFLWS